MGQFSLYQNIDPTSKGIYPYLLDVQSDLLSALGTRLVIPVAAKKKFDKVIIRNLNPVIKIENKEYIVITQQMAAIPKKSMGQAVCDCLSMRQEILSAIDFLITGI